MLVYPHAPHAGKGELYHQAPESYMEILADHMDYLIQFSRIHTTIYLAEGNILGFSSFSISAPPTLPTQTWNYCAETNSGYEHFMAVQLKYVVCHTPFSHHRQIQ